MHRQKKCSFHRALNSTGYGIGIGLCDLEGGHTICDGDIQYCEKAEALINYLFQGNSKHQARRAMERDRQSQMR